VRFTQPKHFCRSTQAIGFRAAACSVQWLPVVSASNLPSLRAIIPQFSFAVLPSKGLRGSTTTVVRTPMLALNRAAWTVATFKHGCPRPLASKILRSKAVTHFKSGF